jgi:hypothetical protein
VLRKPGLMLSKDMKVKIYSIAGLYLPACRQVRQIDMSLSSDMKLRTYSLIRHIAKLIVIRRLMPHFFVMSF